MSASPGNSPPEHPVFDGGSFSIPYFSESSEGFSFETKRALGRTQAINGTLSFSEIEKQSFVSALQDEMGTKGVDNVRAARTQWRHALATDASPEEIARLKQNFEEIRDNYINTGKKIGFRALELTSDDTLAADIQLVDFKSYVEFANAGNRSELLEYSAASAVALIMRTADNRLVIQQRAVQQPLIRHDGAIQGNATYPNVPGASAGGMLDASLRNPRRRPGTPDSIDTDTIKGALLKEVSEELGLAPSQLNKLRIVGVAHDNVKIHPEMLLLADTSMTASELQEASRNSHLNKDLGDADFAEKFFDMDGSPDAIATLLTEVRCPIPSTHAAALVAAGSALVVDQSGPEAAREWRDGLQEKIRDNYRAIDQIVTQYYLDFPDAAHQVPERFWDKNTPRRRLDAFTPSYTPEEQGLPSFEDEMVRTGLLPETREPVSHAHIIDTTVRPETDNLVIVRLDAGEPVALISNDVNESANALIQKIKDPTLLNQLLVVAPSGDAWITFAPNGTPQYRELHYKNKSHMGRDVAARRFVDFLAESNKSFKDAAFSTHGDTEGKINRELTFHRLTVNVA